MNASDAVPQGAEATMIRVAAAGAEAVTGRMGAAAMIKGKTVMSSGQEADMLKKIGRQPLRLFTGNIQRKKERQAWIR